jgi:hypothetical protein
MMLALGAMSTALDALTSLTQSKKPAGAGQAASAFDTSGATPPTAPVQPVTTGFSSQSGGLSPSTLSAVLAALGQSSDASAAGASDAMKDFFKQIDADQNGTISKSEFETALGAGGSNLAMAGSVFGKLDANADGSVSLEELSAALKPPDKDRRHGSGGPQDGSGDPLLDALDDAAAVGGDDGTAVDSATRSKRSNALASANAMSSYNFVEQLIQSQQRAVAASSTSTLGLTA